MISSTLVSMITVLMSVGCAFLSLVLVPSVAALALVIIAVPLGIMMPVIKSPLLRWERSGADGTDLDDHMHIPEVQPSFS